MLEQISKRLYVHTEITGDIQDAYELIEASKLFHQALSFQGYDIYLGDNYILVEIIYCKNI